MEVRQLHYFVEVARKGSFSRAALSLGMAQPALSRQVQQLEAELAIPLFYRNGRGVSLTSAGELLLSHATTILNSLSTAASEVAALRGQPTGTAVIGVPPTVGRVLTLPLARGLKQRYPLVSVRIVEGFSGHILEWLANGRIDVGLFYDDPMMHRFVLEPLVQEALCLIGPAEAGGKIEGDAVPAAKLGELPLILPSRPHGLRLYLDETAERLKLDLQVELEVDALFSMLQAVREGLGFTVLPRAAIFDDSVRSALSVWEIAEPALIRVLSMSTYVQRPTAIASRQVAGIVRDEVRSLMAEGYWKPLSERMDAEQTG